MMSTMPQVPPGQSPPFAAVTDTDHRAWIIIATALGISMTLLSSSIRIFVRQTIGPGWGLDDVTLALSTVSTVSCLDRFALFFNLCAAACLLRAIVAHFGSVRGWTWEIHQTHFFGATVQNSKSEHIVAFAVRSCSPKSHYRCTTQATYSSLYLSASPRRRSSCFSAD